MTPPAEHANTQPTRLERELELRRTLPDLHVGRAPSGVWHILSARDQEPLCYPGMNVDILEDGPLDGAVPGWLCKHCARKQGDDYGEW